MRYWRRFINAYAVVVTVYMAAGLVWARRISSQLLDT